MALSGNEPFTFKDRLYAIINDDKRKIKTEIIETSKGKKVTKQEDISVDYTTFNDEEIKKFTNFDEKSADQEQLIYNSKYEEDVNEK